MISLLAVAGDCRKHAAPVDLADALAGHFDEEQIAGTIKLDAERCVQLCFDCRRAVLAAAAAGDQDELFGG